MSSNDRLGWNPFFEEQVRAAEDVALTYARVVEEQRGKYRVDGDVEGWTEVSGRFRHEAATAAEFPTVGDWVGVANGIVHRRLERRSAISRAAPESGEQQVVAANVDVVFVVTSIAHERNARRAERYLTAVWDGGAVPVVLLNKSDLVEDPDAAADELRARLPFVEVHAVSALNCNGPGSDPARYNLDACAGYLQPGQTVALVGPSGVGKSTIVNALVGEERQRTGAVREADSKGRHTTTARQLIELPSGALLIDTPGMREVQLWGDESAVDSAFDDIVSLAERCRFDDCAHETEPDCAVRAAVDSGALAADRLEHYRRLLREAAFEARKTDKAAAADLRRQWKAIHRAQKSLYRLRGRT